MKKATEPLLTLEQLRATQRANTDLLEAYQAAEELDETAVIELFWSMDIEQRAKLQHTMQLFDKVKGRKG